MKQTNKNGTQMVKPNQKPKTNTSNPTHKPKIEPKTRVPARGGIRIG